MAVFAEAYGYQLQPGDEWENRPSGYPNNEYWMALAADGSRRIADWEKVFTNATSKADELRERQPDADIYFCQASNANFVSGKTRYVGYNWITTPDDTPVNQVPYLDGYARDDGSFTRGFMHVIGEFAHEAIAFDPVQLGRMHHQSHSAAHNAALSDDNAKRAGLALKYGRLLPGYAYGLLAAWEEHDPADELGAALWQAELPDLSQLVMDICEGECANPHWVLDFALNMVPDDWEDALNEQSPIQQQPQAPLRRVYLPRVLKEANGWIPGSLNLADELFHIHQTTTNPIRYWESLTRNCARAAGRYRERYAARPDAHLET